MHKIKLFDDEKSLLHTLAAMILAAIEPCVSVAATIAFTIYELAASETMDEATGDILEWLIGLIIGAIVKVVIAMS